METLLFVALLWFWLAVAYFAWPVVRRRVAAPRRGVRVLKEVHQPALTEGYNDRVVAAAAALERPAPRRVVIPFPVEPGAAGPSMEPLEAAVPHFLAEAVGQVRREPALPAPRETAAEQPASQPQTAVAKHEPTEDEIYRNLQKLRREITVLITKDEAVRYERPRLRHYRTGAYAYLPRDLRRQVSEVRGRRTSRV